MWVCVWVHFEYLAHVKVRGQPSRIDSFLPQWRFRGSNSGHRAWWLVPPLTELLPAHKDSFFDYRQKLKPEGWEVVRGRAHVCPKSRSVTSGTRVHNAFPSAPLLPAWASSTNTIWVSCTSTHDAESLQMKRCPDVLCCGLCLWPFTISSQTVVQPVTWLNQHSYWTCTDSTYLSLIPDNGA